MKKETVKNIIKIAVAAAIFVTAIVNYDFLSNLDIRTLIAGASSIFTNLLAGCLHTGQIKSSVIGPS